MPKIQANICGAADALMLDLEGFVSGMRISTMKLHIHTHKLHPEDKIYLSWVFVSPVTVGDVARRRSSASLTGRMYV